MFFILVILCIIPLQKIHQIINLLSNLLTIISVLYEHALLFHIDNLRLRFNIPVAINCHVNAHKWMMLFNLHSMRIIDKCISGYSCSVMISFAETAVYNNQFSISPDWMLPFLRSDRSMNMRESAR